MPQTPVTTYIHQTLYVQGYLCPESPLNFVFVLDHIPEFVDFFR
jgi:hypothetical protein